MVNNVISENEVELVRLGEMSASRFTLCFGHSIKTQSWFPFVITTAKMIEEETKRTRDAR